MKATEQYFHVVLFITLYNVVPPCESVDEILSVFHLNKQYFPVVLFIVQHHVILNIESMN